MKKILSSILTITSTMGVFTPILTLSSCNKEEDPDNIEAFIKNRTFSILGKYTDAGGDISFCFGTIWIIDDATPNIDNDYKYYVATNWHVTHGLDTLKTKYPEMIYCYADDSLMDERKPYISHMAYRTFGSYEKLENSEYDYIYDQYESEETEYWKPAIDFHICKVDFDNGTRMSSKMQAKFSSLNEYKKGEGNGHITKFINGDANGLEKKKKYVGGYPADGKGTPSDPGSAWEFRELLPNQLEYVPSEVVLDPEPDNQLDHYIGTPDVDKWGYPIHWEPGTETEQWYWYDVAPLWLNQTGFSSAQNWMNAGASGSMLITEDKEVCGIYWGGFGGMLGTRYYPAFSCFKTSQKDYLEDILPK